MNDVVILLTTWPDQTGAEQAAENWVNKKLAACVNILPKMRSIYQWGGKLYAGDEHQVIIKTTSNKAHALQQVIIDTHPYECPEILILPVSGGYDKYLNWITGLTQ